MTWKEVVSSIKERPTVQGSEVCSAEVTLPKHTQTPCHTLLFSASSTDSANRQANILKPSHREAVNNKDVID